MKDTRPALRCGSTGGSSQRLGACEVCKGLVSDVWFGRIPNPGIDYVYGHEGCVKTKRFGPMLNWGR